MAVDLRMLNANGNYSEVLPDWSDLTFSQDLVAPGTLTFTYPIANPYCPAATNSAAACTCFGRNAHMITHGSQLVVLLDGREPRNGRFTYFEGSGSRIIETGGGTATFSCTSNLQRFDKLLLAPAFNSQFVAENDPTVQFKNLSVGAIMITVLGNAMARANQKSGNPTPWFTYPIPSSSFSGSVDATGTTWPANYDNTFNIGDTVLSVIQWAVDNGLAEPAMDGKLLKLYLPSNNGRDLSGGANPVVLQTGRDFTEATFQTSSTDLVNALFVLGDQTGTVLGTSTAPTFNTYACTWILDQNSINQYGYREATWQLSGAIQQSTLGAAGAAYLASRKAPRYSYTYTVTAQYLEAVTRGSQARPFLDYQVGDTVRIMDGVENQPRRLRLLSATWPSARTALVALTVSDWFAEHDVELDRRLKRAGL